MVQVNQCHVMAKPSGSVCNIDCEYCFYLEKEQLYPERQANWRMSDDTLERFIQQYIEAQSGPTVEFAWQGGEPTLLGLDFYQRVVELCAQHAQGKQIYHSFQTNGLLIDDKWCEFFKHHNILVGISIDGPQHLHDQYRVTRSKKGTHAKVMQAIELLKKHRIEFNTLTVVSSGNANSPLEVYEFLKSIGSKYIQFIPLVERLSTDDNQWQLDLASPNDHSKTVTSWSVSPRAYSDFLVTIFKDWITKDVGSTFVQTFDSTLASWLNQPAGICTFAAECGHSFALESNGDLYQCDHYVYPEYKLGNINQTTIEIMNNSPKAVQFSRAKSSSLNSKCNACRFKFACHGGCPKHRFITTNTGQHHNYLCEGYFEFFKQSEKAMMIMARLLEHRRPATEIMTLSEEVDLFTE
ncbi:anaerobic sulfatase maturase [Vibrio agarivorans]|uniref:anaerobic sulfatase maturase n=1 Tax=Vibrio agarivorans TaxID=153622 RepID=UPI002231355A|nr:anaerobic sulfatase maturase [Vibrio agarivorans]